MRLATCANGAPDGELIVVSEDRNRALAAGPRWPNLLAAFGDWPAAEADLRQVASRLAAGQGNPFDPASLRAPLPRSWQWLDGSAFRVHADLMQVAFGTDPLPSDRPLMYQGLSDRFYGPFEPVAFRSEADGIDFEGEYGVIVDAVPMGTRAAEAHTYIKLIVQINDWSLRSLALPEMKTGFGWIQAKPACSVAPVAVTPDELGDAWRDGRVHLPILCSLNGREVGHPNAGVEMQFGFHELIAHAAKTRPLGPGTIIGSGTVSNSDRATGVGCIAERRMIEKIESGESKTAFLKFGDVVRIEMRDADGHSVFGAIEQKVVKAA